MTPPVERGGPEISRELPKPPSANVSARMRGTVESTFVGRTSEIARLDALGAGTLVTLWGPGGVGKTRLAREFAQRERRRGRIVAWADLAGARTPRETLVAIASALGIALAGADEGSGAASGDEVEALGRAACAQRALLVADNLEQLDDDARKAVVRLARVVVASGLRAEPRFSRPRVSCSARGMTSRSISRSRRSERTTASRSSRRWRARKPRSARRTSCVRSCAASMRFRSRSSSRQRAYRCSG